ncbi:MAG: hypothetical protein ROZ09_15910 [Thiobacillus sp.]|jgi:hypothetical protein|uniref:hypothetical protein n=1 Tax=Thiobacillus sp. TaxID=924 RepID=UPI002894C853|nr:hypothetical protein [Thiobacillus sp.]MDT3708304.1 hypothetical protein [Thiobacillus sp.]
MNRYLSTVLGVMMFTGSASALACAMGSGQQGGHRMGMGSGHGMGMGMHAMMHSQGQQCGQGMNCMSQAMADPGPQSATEDAGNLDAGHDHGQAEAAK